MTTYCKLDYFVDGGQYLHHPVGFSSSIPNFLDGSMLSVAGNSNSSGLRDNSMISNGSTSETLSQGTHHHGSSNGRRKRSWSRAVFSNLQRKGLEKRFQLQKYITKPDRRQLAATLGLTDAQVNSIKVLNVSLSMVWCRLDQNLCFPNQVIQTLTRIFYGM